MVSPCLELQPPIVLLFFLPLDDSDLDDDCNNDPNLKDRTEEGGVGPCGGGGSGDGVGDDFVLEEVRAGYPKGDRVDCNSDGGSVDLGLEGAREDFPEGVGVDLCGDWGGLGLVNIKDDTGECVCGGDGVTEEVTTS